MEDHRSKDLRLAGRTILIAPSAPRELVIELERCGARVIIWPEVEIAEPESFSALDEAIENLFGYDWLILRTSNAAEFFLKRFQKLGHEVSELDTLRVCAIGGATVERLEASQVHIDVIPHSSNPDIIVDAIGNYVGGQPALGRLNFLIPRASTAPDRLRDLLEEAEARVDVITAYRVVLPRGESHAHISALLAGGGIDCVVFTATAAVREFAGLFNTNDLLPPLKGVAIACIGDATTTRAREYGLNPDIIAADKTAFPNRVASYFLD